MSRAPPLRPHRSSIEWGVRITLALVAAVLGYFAVAHSLAQVLRTAAPERAHALAPYDGRITAYLSKVSGPKADTAQREEADRLARLALRQDPTAVAAVATLGINAQVRGETEAARRHFAYSDKLSRRDLTTRLWMIEDAVAKDDIPEALRNYDIALRTSRSAPDLLFPVLASASTDESIRAELVKTLAAKPPWGENFIAFVAENGEHAVATARLFQGLRRARVPISDIAQAAVVGKLVADRDYNAAWTYYASTRAGVNRRHSRDPQFAANLSTPSPFDWAPMGGVSGVSTVIQSGTRDGIFDFTAPPSVGGLLLQQLQMLPPGNYLLEGHSIGIDQSESARPYWMLTCLEGRELGRVILPNSTENRGVFLGRFTVPSDCAVQYLRLVARPSNAVGGLSGQIDKVTLRPVN